MNATCKDCKKVGHFTNMPACRLIGSNYIKIEAVNMAKSTDVVKIMAMGRSKNVPINLEAETGGNVTFLIAGVMQDLDWVQMEATDMHIQGCSGVTEPCLRKHI